MEKSTPSLLFRTDTGKEREKKRGNRHVWSESEKGRETRVCHLSMSPSPWFRCGLYFDPVLKSALPPSLFPNLKEGRKMSPRPPPSHPTWPKKENFIAMIQKSVLFGSRFVLITGNQSQIKKERKFAGSGFATFSQPFSQLFFCTSAKRKPKHCQNKKKRRNCSQFQRVTVSLLSSSTKCGKRKAARIDVLR